MSRKIVFFKYCFQPSEHVNTVLSSWAVQKNRSPVPRAPRPRLLSHACCEPLAARREKRPCGSGGAECACEQDALRSPATLLPSSLGVWLSPQRLCVSVLDPHVGLQSAFCCCRYCPTDCVRNASVDSFASLCWTVAGPWGRRELAGGAEAVGRARRPGWIHTRAVFPVVLFGSSVFRNEAYFHTTNSCVVSVVVDYQIFLCVLKVIKRACNGCVRRAALWLCAPPVNQSWRPGGFSPAPYLPPPHHACLDGRLKSPRTSTFRSGACAAVIMAPPDCQDLSSVSH